MKAKAFSILAAGVLAALPTVAISSSAQAEELEHSQLTEDGCSNFYYNAEWGIQPPRHPDLDCRAIETIVKTIGVPEQTSITAHWTTIPNQSKQWGYSTSSSVWGNLKRGVTYRETGPFPFFFGVTWFHH